MIQDSGPDEAPDRRCALYLVTPPQIDLEPFVGQVENALSGGPVACLQLRLKDVDDDVVMRAAEALIPLCHANDVAFVMNDRADLAQQVGADAVHLGQSDGRVADARAQLGDKVAIGVTCHSSRHLALEAGEAGADYVAFGAFFPSTTKEPPEMASPDILTWWQQFMVLPCVAIGGITVDNCRPLINAGADMLAVSSGVWDHPQGPAEAVRAFNAAFSAAENQSPHGKNTPAHGD